MAVEVIANSNPPTDPSTEKPPRIIGDVKPDPRLISNLPPAPGYDQPEPMEPERFLPVTAETSRRARYVRPWAIATAIVVVCAIVDILLR